METGNTATQRYRAPGQGDGRVDGERYFRRGLITPPMHRIVRLDKHAQNVRADYCLRDELLIQAGLAGFINQTE